MIFAILLIVAVTGVALQMMALCLRLGSGCTCHKGAVDWRCPVHGSES